MSKTEVLKKLQFDPARYTAKEKVAFAERGKFLSRLVNDKDWQVRQTVAMQGYGLDILVNDKNPDVREAVAQQGYGLDKLINDRTEYVRHAVNQYRKRQNDK